MWPTLTLGLMVLLAGVNGWDSLLESRLVDELMKEYNNNVIPTTAKEPIVTVEHGITVLSISSFEHGKLSLDTWTMMMWTDQRLKWDPLHYDNVTSTHIFHHLLWTPDIVPNYKFPYVESRMKDLRAIVHHSGLVTIVPPSLFTMPCVVSTGAEEIYTCKTRAGSWTYSGRELDIENSGGIVNMGSDFTEDESWAITNSTVVRNSVIYSCCPDPYPHLLYTIELKPKHHRQHCN